MINGFAGIPIIRILKISDNPVIPLITVQTTENNALSGAWGKLSLFAMFIVEFATSEELETTLPKPPPIVYHNTEEYEAAERIAQLLGTYEQLSDGKRGSFWVN